jgi:hypothetical protein
MTLRLRLGNLCRSTPANAEIRKHYPRLAEATLEAL